jgi:hypothetical protein
MEFPFQLNLNVFTGALRANNEGTPCQALGGGGGGGGGGSVYRCTVSK